MGFLTKMMKILYVKILTTN